MGHCGHFSGRPILGDGRFTQISRTTSAALSARPISTAARIGVGQYPAAPARPPSHPCRRATAAFVEVAVDRLLRQRMRASGQIDNATISISIYSDGLKFIKIPSTLGQWIVSEIEQIDRPSGPCSVSGGGGEDSNLREARYLRPSCCTFFCGPPWICTASLFLQREDQAGGRRRPCAAAHEASGT